MRGELKESRLAYKSEWLEVYEDLLSTDTQPNKRSNRNSLHHHKNTNNVRLFNKIKLKSDSATILPVFSDGCQWCNKNKTKSKSLLQFFIS
jgi:hypothetical protein